MYLKVKFKKNIYIYIIHFVIYIDVQPRRKKLLRQSERKAKHYRGPLRGVTLRLLNFNYKNVKSDTRQRLAEMEQPSLHRLDSYIHCV